VIVGVPCRRPTPDTEKAPIEDTRGLVCHNRPSQAGPDSGARAWRSTPIQQPATTPKGFGSGADLRPQTREKPLQTASTSTLPTRPKSARFAGVFYRIIHLPPEQALAGFEPSILRIVIIPRSAAGLLALRPREDLTTGRAPLVTRRTWHL